MKIQYKFATETVTIEVDDRWGELLVDLNRQEYNNDHKETRRHSSMDALAEQGVQFAAEQDALAALAEEEPEDMASDRYTRWADRHEALEDALDDILDLLDE